MEQYQRLTVRHAIGIAAPHTWVAAVFPVLLGSLLAYSLRNRFNPLLFFALLAASVLLQATVNTFNDYYDFVKGNDRPENSDDPGDAILVYNRLDPRHVKALGFSFLGTALALGCYAVYCGGLVPLVLGAFGALIILLYSAGRVPISYSPLGEIVSGVVMGELITIACYAAHTSGHVSPLVALLAFPFTMGIGLIMMTNNTCDIERDAAVGRHTLPVLAGRQNMRIIHRVCQLVWLLSVFSLVLLWFPWGLAVPVAALALGVRVLLAMWNAPLTPDARGMCMGAILKMNLLCNTCYLAAILAHTLVSGGGGLAQAGGGLQWMP